MRTWVSAMLMMILPVTCPCLVQAGEVGALYRGVVETEDGTAVFVYARASMESVDPTRCSRIYLANCTETAISVTVNEEVPAQTCMPNGGVVGVLVCGHQQSTPVSVIVLMDEVRYTKLTFVFERDASPGLSVFALTDQGIRAFLGQEPATALCGSATLQPDASSTGEQRVVAETSINFTRAPR